MMTREEKQQKQQQQEGVEEEPEEELSLAALFLSGLAGVGDDA